jgi:hypothetical protein
VTSGFRLHDHRTVYCKSVSTIDIAVNVGQMLLATTALRCPALYFTVLHFSVLLCAELNCTVQYSTVLC